jgi:hypothetical protein
MNWYILLPGQWPASINKPGVSMPAGVPISMGPCEAWFIAINLLKPDDQKSS